MSKPVLSIKEKGRGNVVNQPMVGLHNALYSTEYRGQPDYWPMLVNR